MTVKMINIAVPLDWKVPEIINTLAPEENAFILSTGAELVRDARNVVAGLSQKEIYNKIQEETKEDLQKLQMDLLVQKELNSKMGIDIRQFYEKQMEELKNQVNTLRKQLDKYDTHNRELVDIEVNKVKAKYDLLLEEKDKQNQLNREVFDKASILVSKNLNKSSIALGNDGENIFEYLSETFKDFKGYNIENKAKQGHKGDFHLFFDNFNVLVDSKNYSDSVQKKEIKKIIDDLQTNKNMNFAWMVSLNSNISGYNRFPITCKWITTDTGIKCILFINKLLENKDPINILRQAWLMCDEFNKLTQKDVNNENGKLTNDDSEELTKYKEKDLIIKKQIESLQERTSELRRSINVSYNVLKQMDNELLEMISLVSNKIVKEKLELNDKIKKWWDDNLEFSNNCGNLTSTEIWNKYKKNNKEYVMETKLTIELFKDIITTFVSKSNYVEKTKKGAIDFLQLKWKCNEEPLEENVVLENIVIENIELPKKTRLSKKKTEEDYYFSSEIDCKIIKEYDNIENDIMIISKNLNVRPWQVVSVLMRHKVLTNRSDARGYDIYKETDEYKQKMST